MSSEKLLLAYLCLITKLCLVAGIQELPGINKFIKAMNTTNLGLIRDAINLLTK